MKFISRIALLLLAVWLAIPSSADERPNILFVFTDDHAAHAMGGEALRPDLRHASGDGAASAPGGLLPRWFHALPEPRDFLRHVLEEAALVAPPGIARSPQSWREAIIAGHFRPSGYGARSSP